ncbi:MAG: EAL domain-containing protein [Ectothiorhodospiraceae bacterium]
MQRTIGRSHPESAAVAAAEVATPFLLVGPRPAGVWTHVVAAFLMIAGMELGWLFWVEEGAGALIWPPAGLALGLATAHGIRALPAPILALVIWGTVATSGGILAWALVGVGLFAGATTGSACLHWARGQSSFRGPVRELLAFWLFGTVVAALVSTAFGVPGLALQLPSFSEHRLLDIIGAYWLAEAFGILLIAPATLLLATRLGDGLSGVLARPSGWHGWWALGLVLLALLQFLLVRVGSPSFAGVLVYLYFPLLAVAAGLGRPLFQSLATLTIGVVFILQSLSGVGGAMAPSNNAELIEVIVVVMAFTIMAQVVSASSETIRRQLNQAREAARRDYLTDLLNERGLGETLTAGGEREQTLALVDLPAVRRLLDLTGLQRTDRFELELADRLQSSEAGRGSIARLGRGLYALLLPGSSEQGAAALGTLYSDLDGETVPAGPVSLALRPAVGAIQLGPGEIAADEAVSMASLSVQRAARELGTRLRIDDRYSGLQEAELAVQATVSAVRDALGQADGFRLFGQRIEPLGARRGERGRYEVLIRMIGDDGELLGPGQFLPDAAQHGLMPEIDRWVVEHAFRFMATQPGAVLTINLSGASISDPRFGEWIEERRAHHGVTARDVWFEITESDSVENPAAAEALISRLRDKGFRIAIDDFGTGLASFDYIRNFSVDAVKIDGSFVRELRSRATDRAIVLAIQQLARSLSLVTVAEFVEDQWLEEWLEQAGIDYAQGFGIGRPCPIEDCVDSESRGGSYSPFQK